MPRHVNKVTNYSKSNLRARNAHERARKEFVQYDTTPIRPKKSKAPIILACVLGVIVLILIFAFVVPNVFAASNKGSLSASDSATVVIENGDSALEVAQKFEDEKLVLSAQKFAVELDETGAANSLIPGSYTFSGQTETKDMASRLKYGFYDELPKVTVVEGYTIKSIANAVEEASSQKIKASDFISMTSDASKFASQFEFLREVGTNSLEGFLLPKTYEIEANETAQTLIVKMLNQYKSEVDDLDFSYPKKMGLSVYDAIKLASVVQKESPANLHARVAGIFYNRLNSDSPYLQSDATTAYIVGHDPTAEEVHANDPYSTYTNAGVPPTPICNPSIDSIYAVCNPEQNNYRFFYTNKDGSYVFSQTYEEHLKAIEDDTK